MSEAGMVVEQVRTLGPIPKTMRAGVYRGKGVARVEEGVQLREAGIDAPILLLSEAPTSAADTVVSHRITPVVYTEAGIENVLALGGDPPLDATEELASDYQHAIELIDELDTFDRFSIGVAAHCAKAARTAATAMNSRKPCVPKRRATGGPNANNHTVFRITCIHEPCRYP